MDEAAKKLAKAGYDDPVFFAHWFVPHWFGAASSEGRAKPMPWVHRGLLAILTGRTAFLETYGDVDKIIRNFSFEREGENGTEVCEIFYRDEDGILRQRHYSKVEIMLPRGFSKTTLINTGLLYDIVYQNCKFPVYLSESGPHATEQLGNIKSELEFDVDSGPANERLFAVFGNLKSLQRSGKWREDHIETTTGINLLARGRGAQIRGKNINSSRPDKIILDDVEDEESVKTEEQRVKTRKWLYAAVEPALPVDGSGTLYAIGTLLHDDALLRTLQRDEDYACIVFGAYDKDGNLLWPWRMSEKKLDRLKRRYARAGQLSTFYMEYHNTLRTEEEQRFKSFIYSRPQVDHQSVFAIAIDPAISKKKKASEATISVASMNATTGLIHVWECWGKVGATPREMVDVYFELSKKYNCRFHGIETIAFQAALTHLMREEMFRKRHYFEITPITHSEKKEERIEGILQPRYANGYIHHVRPYPELETQLLDWPNGKNDRADSLAMVVALLDPLAAYAADPSNDITADEFEPHEASAFGAP